MCRSKQDQAEERDKEATCKRSDKEARCIVISEIAQRLTVTVLETPCARRWSMFDSLPPEDEVNSDSA
jgi:hypothetical protein